MARGKKSLKDPCRVTLVLEKEHYEHIRQVAINISAKEKQQISPVEAMRIALEEKYPVSA